MREVYKKLKNHQKNVTNFKKMRIMPAQFNCMFLLGRRQAVRPWVLIPVCAGSNPAGPAILFFPSDNQNLPMLRLILLIFTVAQVSL